MAMLVTEIGNGSGFIYITQADGTTILSNIVNTGDVFNEIQKFAVGAASLTDPTLAVDATYGFRFFGSTTGTAGSLVGTTELTNILVNRGIQSPLPKRAATIATGVIELARPGSILVMPVSNQGAAGTDDLDTITVTGVVDNDLLIVTGADPAQVATLRHGIGNIFLSNNANFSTGSRQTSIILKYSSAVTAGWYEVARGNVLPTVANLRLNSVAEPVQGINATDMATSGTTTYVPGTDKGYQIINGSPVLVGAVSFTTGGSPMDGDEFTVDYRATPTLGAFGVTIFGIALTATQAQQKCVVRTKYRTTGATWYSTLYVNGNAIDFVTTTQLATKENSLGNPAADGMVLSSTAAGVRSWVSNDSGASIIYNTTANNATAANTTKTTLKTYTLPASTLAVDGDFLIIRAIFQTAANANGKTVGIDFGATTVATATFDANNDTFELIVIINRVGQNSQSALGKALQWDTATGAAVGNYGIYTSPAENFAADIVINIFGTNGVATASDIISRQGSVEVYKKRN